MDVIGQDIKVLFLKKDIPNIALGVRKFELKDYCFTRWLKGEKEIRISAEKGFIWDGATIPRIFWSLIGFYPAGIMLPASLWHDLIYVKKGWVHNYITKETEHISRKHCDQLFYKHMIKCGVPEKKARLMYKVVRIGGFYYWQDFTWVKDYLGSIKIFNKGK